MLQVLLTYLLTHQPCTSDAPLHDDDDDDDGENLHDHHDHGWSVFSILGRASVSGTGFF